MCGKNVRIFYCVMGGGVSDHFFIISNLLDGDPGREATRVEFYIYKKQHNLFSYRDKKKSKFEQVH